VPASVALPFLLPQFQRYAVLNLGPHRRAHASELRWWFAEQIPLAEKILRTVIAYAAIAVLFRLTGKRGLAALNTFDFVVIFLLSNVVQNAVIGNDTSVTGGLIGAVTLVAVNTGVNRLIAASATAAYFRRARDNSDHRRPCRAAGAAAPGNAAQ
jgi:hypothetical protein